MQGGWRRAHDAVVSKARLETLSDGIFAIAITLLVLTIAQPSNYRNLAHELGGLWPSLAAYVVSFTVIGIMWLNHHSVFSKIEGIDRGVFFLNLVLLMTIVFIPYPTGVLGQALGKEHGERVAAVFYTSAMVVNAMAWSALWLYVSVGRRRLHPGFPESERRTTTLLFTSGAFVYLAAVGVAFLNAYACLAFHGALAIYYALDPVSRRAARHAAGEGG
jgi:uncharacterized membrane protein